MPADNTNPGAHPDTNPSADPSADPGADPEVVYHGHRRPMGGSVITVETPDGEVLGVLRHVVLHSPTGMSWGYAGSGAADTARSLLIAALGEPAARCPACQGTGTVVYDPALNAERPHDPARADGDDPQLVFGCHDCSDGYRRLPYQEFKEQFVATWPPEWQMTRREILRWLTRAESTPLSPHRSARGRLADD